MRSRIHAVGGLLGAILFLASFSAQATTRTVTSVADSGTGTLRNTIAASGNGDTINFSVTGTITLTSGQLLVSHNINIAGPGAVNLAVTAASNLVFKISNGTNTGPTVTISGLMIENSGTGIYNDHGQTTAVDCEFVNNSEGASNNGAGVSASATMTINNSAFLYNDNAIDNASNSGGDAELSLANCTIYGNHNGIINSSDGSVHDVASVILNSCTLAYNYFGSNTANITGNHGSVTAGNTIFAQSGFDPNFGTGSIFFTSNGYNLYTDDGPFTGTTGDQFNVDPQLDVNGPQYNGGSTRTVAITYYGTTPSPALDHGNSLGLTTDQRGQPRVYDNPNIGNGTGSDGADVGAYEAPADPLQGAYAITVTTNADHDDGVCGAYDCSLREAIVRTNEYHSSSSSISLGFGGTIVLTVGELDITSPVYIFGPGARSLAISGNHAFRIFSVSAQSTFASIYGLTIENGNAGAIFSSKGGAIFVAANASLYAESCTFTGNSATGPPGTQPGAPGINAYGGAISNDGTLYLVSCTLGNNTATGGKGANGSGSINGGPGGIPHGSAIYNNTSGTLTMTQCTVSGNSATGGNGGNGGSSGGNGGAAVGGVFNEGTMTVESSTISSNTGTGGVGGTGTSVNGSAGAGYGGLFRNAGTCTVRNTISAGNNGSTGADVIGAFTSNGYNLIGKNNLGSGFGATGDQTGTNALPLNALLGPLQNNDGPTDTIALLPGSPALDKGTMAGLTADSYGVISDQRGIARSFDDFDIANANGTDATDIGAFEYWKAPAYVVSRKIHGSQSFEIPMPVYTLVNTVAGSAGSVGTSDGIGAAARFDFPTGIAVDGSGNSYVPDYGNNTIRKTTSAGVVTTLAGLAGSSGSTDGTGSAARFNSPHGVAADSNGNVYVADYGNHTIRKITSAGVVSTFAGLAGSSGSANGTGNAARFNHPTGVALDSLGNVYVADSGNQTVRKITNGAVVSTLAGLAGSSGSADGTGSAARFNSPFDVAVDSSGNVYVADFNNDTIRKITSATVVSTLAGAAGLTGSSDGTGSAARFNGPTGVGVDGLGNIYVADFNNDTIRKATPAGVVTTVAGLAGSAGGLDGVPSSSRFNGPGDVAPDASGKIYVADTNNHTVRSITSPRAGIECRTGGGSGAHELIVRTQRRSMTYGSLVATPDPNAPGATASAPPFSGLSGNSVYVDLSNVSNAQTLSVTVTGLNDGVMSYDLTIPMAVLLGDANADGSVNSADIAQTKSKSGQPVDSTSFRTDVNVDASLNSADISLVKSKSGTALPANGSILDSRK